MEVEHLPMWFKGLNAVGAIIQEPNGEVQHWSQLEFPVRPGSACSEVSARDKVQVGPISLKGGDPRSTDLTVLQLVTNGRRITFFSRIVLDRRGTWVPWKSSRQLPPLQVGATSSDRHAQPHGHHGYPGPFSLSHRQQRVYQQRFAAAASSHAACL
ncbi:hypothetical protein JCM11491_002438 [Sporobolomyces phaffii]